MSKVNYRDLVRNNPRIMFFLIFLFIVIGIAFYSWYKGKKISGNPKTAIGVVYEYNSFENRHRISYEFYDDTLKYTNKQSSDFEIHVGDKFKVVYQADNPYNSILFTSKQVFNYAADSITEINATISSIWRNILKYQYTYNETNYSNTKFLPENVNLKQGDIISIYILKSNPFITKPDYSNLISYDNSHSTRSWIIYLIIGIISIIILIFIPYRAILNSYRNELGLGVWQIISIKVRRVNVDLIVDTLSDLKSHNIFISPDILEYHYLYGGDMTNLKNGIVESRKLGLELSDKELLALAQKHNPLSDYLKDKEVLIRSGKINIIDNIAHTHNKR